MTLIDDRRGVSEVIGVLLIFSFLVIAFVGYQAAIVPGQNAEVEFQHSQAVEDDFLGVRAAVLNANEQTTQSQAVQLGTTFPSRALALNAPPASGTLTTEQRGQYELSGPNSPNIESACSYASGASLGPVTSIDYTPRYSYATPEPTTHYENTLSYRRYESSSPDSPGEIKLLGSQTLLQGSTLRLYPLHADSELSISGSNSRDVTFAAGRAVLTRTVQGPISVTIPTQLSVDEWLTKTSIDEQTAFTQLTDPDPADGTITLELEGEITTICRPVALNQEAPGQTPADDNQSPPPQTGPSISLRVDDISSIGTNDASFLASYDISNVDSQRFQRVDVQFYSPNAGSSLESGPAGASRGRIDFSTGNGGEDTYDITAMVVYADENGQEYIAASQTIRDTADVRNPTQNADLSTDSTPRITDYTVRDVGQNGPEYDIDFTLSEATSGRAVLASTTTSGGRDSETFQNTASGALTLDTYGQGNEFEIKFLVYDETGAVVDSRTIEDTADGQGPGQPSQTPTPTPTPAPSCTVGSNVNPSALQINQLSNFQAKQGPNRWQFNIQVQDQDGDSDLSQIKYQITDSSGTVRATQTTGISGQQYQPGNVKISPDGSYNVQNNEQYTLQVTVCDSDGNSRSLERTATG